MSAERYESALAISTWLKQLCDQNHHTLAAHYSELRITGKLPEPESPFFGPESFETDYDRRLAKSHFKRVFYEYVFDHVTLHGVETALGLTNGTIILTPIWILDPSQRAVVNSYRQAPRFGLDRFDKETFKIIPNANIPDQRILSRSVIPTVQKDNERIRIEQSVGGAILLWPREKLPKLEDLLPLALLPADYRPEPKIQGLIRSNTPATPEGHAILAMLNLTRFRGAKRIIGEHFAYKRPYGREAQTALQFEDELKSANPDVEFGTHETFRTAIREVWNRVKPT